MEKNGANILQDKEFHHCRELLTAKRKRLKSQGLGNKRRKADPFSSDDIVFKDLEKKICENI
jgi:hypothetical protein